MSEVRRVKLDVQGTITTFPANPVSFQNNDNVENKLQPTIDGPPIRFTPFFDSRPKIMRWRSLPNTTTYQTLVATLKSSIQISGVRINYQDLNVEGYADFWRPITVQDVAVRLRDGLGPSRAVSNLVYDIDFSFTIQPDIL